MYHNFLGPSGLQGTHMDTLKPKKFKIDNIHCQRGFFTFWAILAHSVAPPAPRGTTGLQSFLQEEILIRYILLTIRENYSSTFRQNSKNLNPMTYFTPGKVQ